MVEIGIRDLSRQSTREWTPPIGAMGGPPAHELDRDLVQHAGLRLLRSEEGTPYLALRDGEHRRTFRVPSDELREALDRFRMRRSLRPLPDHELSEFTRIVEARVTDPDIVVPSYDVGEGFASGPVRPGGEPNGPRAVSADDVRVPRIPVSSVDREVDDLDAILREVDALERPPVAPVLVAKAPTAWNEVADHLDPSPRPVAPSRESISGGRREADPVGDLPRYLRVLQGLVREGGWLGTTAELSGLTGDPPEKVFACIRAYRSELAEQRIVIVPVPTQEGWRWMALDRAQLRSSA